jgi:hypothetical protein
MQRNINNIHKYILKHFDFGNRKFLLIQITVLLTVYQLRSQVTEQISGQFPLHPSSLVEKRSIKLPIYHQIKRPLLIDAELD